MGSVSVPTTLALEFRSRVLLHHAGRQTFVHFEKQTPTPLDHDNPRNVLMLSNMSVGHCRIQRKERSEGCRLSPSAKNTNLRCLLRQKLPLNMVFHEPLFSPLFTHLDPPLPRPVPHPPLFSPVIWETLTFTGSTFASQGTRLSNLPR